MSNCKELSCFVIMPFGEKADTDGKLINFDVIYRYIISAAVGELEKTDGLKINCKRCDDIDEAGSLRIDMFGSIFKEDIVVVDITSMNPDVFYELGVRHALRESISGLIRYLGAKKDEANQVIEDLIGDALKTKLGSHNKVRLV